MSLPIRPSRSWCRVSNRPDLDYNGYFVRRGGRLGIVDQNTGDHRPAQTVRSLADLRRMGWEKHGLTANPKFVDAAGRDYRLQPSSPARDRGERIPGLNEQQFSGRGPDLGAWESE